MSETFTITVEPLGREVECRSDQPILDACLRAGVWLPHACTHGTCGTCKVEVLDGDVEHNDASDFALHGVRAQRGQDADLRRHPQLRRHDRGRHRVRGGCGPPPGGGLRRHRGGARRHRPGDPPARDRPRPRDDVQPRAVRDDRRSGEGRHPDLLDGEPARASRAVSSCRSGGPRAGSGPTGGSSRTSRSATRCSSRDRTAGSSTGRRAPNRRSSSAAARGSRR